MKEKFLKKYLLFLIVLTFAQFLSNKAISEYSIYIQWFVLFLSIIITFFYRSYLFSSNLYLRTYIFLFILFPWLSVIPGYYSHGQTLYQSAFVLSTYSLVFIFYFIFLKYKISETLFINVLIVFAIVYTFLELFQQLTYPNYWFSGREVMETTGDLEIRLGLYKFYMTGINLVILAAFYCWDRLLKNFNKRLLYLFIFLIIGIYAFLARKMDFSFIICIAISYFLTKKRKWYYGFLILTFFSLLYIYSDKIFGDFIEKTQSELSDDDFIRFQSMGFYLNYFDDPLTLILGNSREYGDSAYGEYVHSIQENLHFYRADIGVLAHFSYYGLIGLIPIILFVIFLIKKWSVLPLYIKLYFIFNGIQIIMAFPLNSVIGSFTFTIVLYLMELILQRNRIQYLSKCNNQLKLKTNIATFKWLY